MLSPELIAAAASIANTVIVTSAFVVIGRSRAQLEARHAEERRRLTNAAIAKSTPEFLALQRSTEPKEQGANKPEPLVQLDL